MRSSGDRDLTAGDRPRPRSRTRAHAREELLELDAAAADVGIDPAELRAAFRAGELPGWRKPIRFELGELRAWAKGRRS
jgi:hypothetical protein